MCFRSHLYFSGMHYLFHYLLTDVFIAVVQGMKSTLLVMDQECPRRQGSISNRQMLMKELHLEKLMKKNKVCAKGD